MPERLTPPNQKKLRRICQNATSFVIFANVGFIFRLIWEINTGIRQNATPSISPNKKQRKIWLYGAPFALFSQTLFFFLLGGLIRRKNSQGKPDELPLRPSFSQTFVFFPRDCSNLPGNNQGESAELPLRLPYSQSLDFPLLQA